VQERVRKVEDAGVRPGGEYVLYQVRVNRRVESNHALTYAAGIANSLELPLLVCERLRCDEYANERSHTFVLEGVPEFAAAVRSLGAGYVFHLERKPGDADRAFRKLAGGAAALVTDDYPDTLLDRYGSALPASLGLDTYAVDSSCIVPMRLHPAQAYAAYSLRPKIHAKLPRFLQPAPAAKLKKRFPKTAFAAHTEVERAAIPALVAGCAIDHSVPPSTSFRGGRGHALERLERFLSKRLRRYAADKNEPSAHATSDLSPYLHWGHVAALEVALAAGEYAREHKLMAEEFLEELIVRRELAFNFCCHAPWPDRLESVPDWARATLDEHRKDARDPVYTPAQLDAAATCDELWNATQDELRLRGKIHGYYRMYWGKKILEWAETPELALATMLHLHDRYALDGRDPNTFANILWCFGLHDRPWPGRPIYGKIRTMTRQGMERKTDTASYLREIAYLKRTGKDLSP
jgi:deoxyribodipyrimidine photo-lyase